jgi:hypothetical protein
MNLSQTRDLARSPQKIVESLQLSSSAVFTLLIFLALLAFELFNYSTTDYAMRDLLGDIGLGSLRWATILAMAFCAMDFAGIARLFSPQEGGGKEKRENWYLLAAWLIAATMNAGLTWWGVSMAIYNHPVQSIMVVDPLTIVTVVPIFVAVLVWILRILIIGSLVSSLNRLLISEKPEKPVQPQVRPSQPFGFKFQPPVPGAAPAGGFVRRPMPLTSTRDQKLPESYTPMDL